MWRSRWSLRILILKSCLIYHAPRFLTTRQAPLTRWSNSLKTLHQVCNERSRTYFSKQFPYIVNQTGNKNKGSDHKEIVSRCITKFPEITSTKRMAIILENLSYQLGHAHGARHCDSIVFFFNLFVLFFQLPARLRTRWSFWWKTATPAQANQMKKVTRMNTWYVFTFFLIIHFFFFRKTLNESCLPCEITGLLSWMTEGRPYIYCRHFTFPKTILQLLPQWPCLWMAARQWGRK